MLKSSVKRPLPVISRASSLRRIGWPMEPKAVPAGNLICSFIVVRMFVIALRQSGSTLPLPACGERVGVRGVCRLRLGMLPPHPAHRASTSPRKRGDGNELAALLDTSPPRLVVERHGVELEPVIDQLVAELARHLGLQLLDLLGLELDHLAGAQIDQMIVVRFRDLLVARAAFAEVVALDDAGILEQLDGAVDRRDRDVLVDLGAAPVELLDVRMVVRNRPARARSRGAARSCACPWRRIGPRCWSWVRSRVLPPSDLVSPIIGDSVVARRPIHHAALARPDFTPDRGATPARSRHCRGLAGSSPAGGRPRGIRPAGRAAAPARCPRPLRETPRARQVLPAGRRCRLSSARASPRPRRADATATERISASPAASRDRMKPCSARPAWRDARRCCARPASARTRRRSSRDGTKRRAAWRGRGVARACLRQRRLAAREQPPIIPIIGAAASRRPAAARRARADRAAWARSCFRRRRRASRATQTMSGARRSSTSAGGGSRAGQAAASMSAPVPTIRDRPLAAMRAASATLAMRGATSVRPPGPKTCR